MGLPRFLRRHGYGAVAEPLPPDLEADIAIICDALEDGGHLVAHSATAAHRNLQQPLFDDAPLDIVPGVPTLVLTGGWEPLYEEVADFLVSTGAEHRQVGGNHRPQDTDAGRQAIRDFLVLGHRTGDS